jgi:hypothetical protein
MTTNGSAGFTGIEVHAKLSDYLKDMAHISYDLGFGWWGKAVASWWKVGLSLDGKLVADEDLFAPHVVACPPGRHTFAMRFHRRGLGALDKLLYERAVTVDVVPGQVTQLLYLSSYASQDLFVLGSWPWVDAAQCPTVNITGFDGKPHPAHAMYRAQGMTMVQFQSGWRHWVNDDVVHPS